MAQLQPRQHIQNFTAASDLEPHWGYASRVIPCTNDAGSCAYLDLVYSSHDTSMLYMGITWSAIGGILFIWALARRIFPLKPHQPADAEPESSTSPARGGLAKLRATIATSSRRYLLPESVRWVFGHTTRLQVLVLLILTAYLTIFSFAGLYYQTWITPVKGLDGVYNTRTTLGPWANRVGVFAYALTPLSVMLATRESILSLLTGVPYQSFMFMHRWLGYIIFVQSALHTIGWCVVEIKLYQPQPKVAAAWIVQEYMVYGIVAMLLLTLLFLLSTKWAIRAFGYEFFRKAHYVLAMIYCGACIGHWDQLHCFITPAIAIWAADRGARFVRTAMLHHGYLADGSVGFSSAKADAQIFPDPDGNGDIVRLDFLHPQSPWDIGKHFFLCFPELSIWQSHPMTPLSPPVPLTSGGKKAAAAGSLHSYIIRAKKGETLKLANLVNKKLASAPSSSAAEKEEQASGRSEVGPQVSVILTGPYGQAITNKLTPETNVLCVAGGTGVTFVLPVLLDIVRNIPVPGRKIEFVWAVRHAQDMEWVRPELDELRAASGSHGVSIDVYVTREAKTHRQSATNSKAVSSAANKEVDAIETASSSGSRSSSEEVVQQDHVAVHRPARVEVPKARRPDVKSVTDAFLAGVARGSTSVFASGPLEMVGELRSAVGAANSGSRVWKGEDRFDVRLVADDRVEW